MGLLILFQTLFICLFSGIIINTYWFSYILFLTFLGGLLVMFIYVSRIASNELFKFSLNNLTIICRLMVIFILPIIFIFNTLKLFNFSFNLEILNLLNKYNFFFNNENKLNLAKLYNNQNFFLIIILITYLFITLLAVVKISNIFYGPLRT